MSVLVLSGETKKDADGLLRTLVEENIYEDVYEWHVVTNEKELEKLDFEDGDIIDDILKRFLDNKIVYVGVHKNG